MIRNHFHKGNLSFKDKFFSLDFYLIFLILLLGIISFFAMYSTEQGRFDYYTKSHVLRFCVFFFIFLLIPFFSIERLHKYSILSLVIRCFTIENTWLIVINNRNNDKFDLKKCEPQMVDRCLIRHWIRLFLRFKMSSPGRL